MHSTAIPVSFDGLWMELHSDIVLFCYSGQEVPGYPYLVSSSLCSLSKDLILPLAFHDLAIDALNVQSGIYAGI